MTLKPNNMHIGHRQQITLETVYFLSVKSSSLTSWEKEAAYCLNHVA